MCRNQLSIQISQLVQELRRSASVAHHALTVFAVALRKMDVDAHIIVICQCFDFFKQLRRTVFNRMRTKPTGDSAFMRLMVLLNEPDIALQLALTYCAVQREKLIHRNMDGILGHLVNHVADASARAKINVVLNDGRHRTVKIAECRRSRFHGFDDIQPRTDDIILVLRAAKQRKNPMNSPDIAWNILCAASHNDIARMDM